MGVFKKPSVTPPCIRGPGGLRIPAAPVDEGAREHEGHLGVVGRLPGNRVEVPAINQIERSAIGIHSRNLVGGIELDQRT